MPNIRLRLDLAGVDLEFQGSEGFYRRLVEPLVEAACGRAGPEGTTAPAALPPAAAPAAPVPEASAPEEAVFRPANPGRFQQFVAQVGERASTAEQRLMAFGFYLWNYEKRERFTAEDAAAFFGTLHLEAPDDVGAVLDDLEGRKRFVERDGDAFGLTTKGVNYVKNRLLGAV